MKPLLILMFIVFGTASIFTKPAKQSETPSQIKRTKIPKDIVFKMAELRVNKLTSLED